MKVSIGLCVFEDADKVRAGLDACLHPALYPFEETEILCVDNSRHPSTELKASLGAGYEWSGKNLKYAATLNRLIQRAKHPYFIYVCLAHCEMRDPSWAGDLVAALERTPGAALAGCRQDGPWNFPAEHIQGGVFAGRTEILRQTPYSARYSHDFSDIAQSRRLDDLGYRLVDVASVRNVCLGQDEPTDWKLLHRSRPRSPAAKALRFLRHSFAPLDVVPRDVSRHIISS